MIGLGLNIWSRGGSGQNPADWPDLKLWLKAAEGGGNILADSSASPLVNGMTRADTGTHDPWVNGGYELTPTDSPDNFSQAYAPRNEIDKLAAIGTKAVLIEFYGTLYTHTGDTTRYLFSIGDWSGTVYGYAVRIASSSGHYTINICAGGATTQSLSNAGSTQLEFTIGVPVHLVAFFAGGTSVVAGGGVNGTVVYRNFANPPGAINITSTVSSSRQVRLGAISGITSTSSPAATNTEVCPANINEFRVWAFDSLPADLPTIIAEMAANPTALPASLRSPIAGSPDSGYPIGAAFS